MKSQPQRIRIGHTILIAVAVYLLGILLQGGHKT